MLICCMHVMSVFLLISLSPILVACRPQDTLSPRCEGLQGPCHIIHHRRLHTGMLHEARSGAPPYMSAAFFGLCC